MNTAFGGGLRRAARSIMEELYIFETVFDPVLARMWRLTDVATATLSRLLMVCIGCSVEFDVQLYRGQFHVQPPFGSHAMWREFFAVTNAALQEASMLQRHIDELGRAPDQSLNTALVNHAGYYFLALVEKSRTALWEDNVTIGLKDRDSTQVRRISDSAAEKENRDLLLRLSAILYEKMSNNRFMHYLYENSVYQQLYVEFQMMSSSSAVSRNDVTKFGCHLICVLSQLRTLDHRLRERILLLMLTPNLHVQERFTMGSLFGVIAVDIGPTYGCVVGKPQERRGAPYITLGTALSANPDELAVLLFETSYGDRTIRIRLQSLSPVCKAPWLRGRDEETKENILISRSAEGHLVRIE